MFNFSFIISFHWLASDTWYLFRFLAIYLFFQFLLKFLVILNPWSAKESFDCILLISFYCSPLAIYLIFLILFLLFMYSIKTHAKHTKPFMEHRKLNKRKKSHISFFCSSLISLQIYFFFYLLLIWGKLNKFFKIIGYSGFYTRTSLLTWNQLECFNKNWIQLHHCA